MEGLDLKELLNIFWSKKIHLLIIISIFILFGMFYSFTMVTPTYESSTTLVLTMTEGNTSNKVNNSITQTDITLNSKLVPTYSELIKSKSVLREVINNLKIYDLNEENIRKNIKISSVANTELIKITVVNINPDYAALVANEIANVFSDKIYEIYNISNVYIVDKAEASTTPNNINHIKDIIIFVFIGTIIGIIYVILSNILDNTIKSEQDIEKATGLLLLASIPEYDFENKKGGRR